ncbi:MAG: hypothetical protein ACLQBK_26295 [Candidatus Sulfotelmatobacter sp.]
MHSFRGAREAKEFLVAKIVEEAQRENVTLSDAERKMLYFSETDWTIPDMNEANDKFSSTCDQDEYEAKITRLVKRAYRHISEEPEEECAAWQAAVRLLSKQDHYILVMIRQSGLRPRGDRLKLLASGVAVAALLVCVVFFADSLSKRSRIDFGRYLPSGHARAFVIEAVAVCVAIGYVLLGLFFEKKGFGDFVLKRLRKVGVPSRRAKK